MFANDLTRRALVLTLLAFISRSHGSLLDGLRHYLGGNFYVNDHGAKCDGQTDDSEVIMKMWNLACNSDMPSGIVLSYGTYMTGPLKFEGPCKSDITLHLEGILRAAPSDLDELRSQDSWVSFSNIDRLTLTGGGTLDGEGERAWKEHDCADTGACHSLPMNIQFTNVTNAFVRNITSVDSKKFHINLVNCENMTFDQILINSPLTILSTDGIHVSRSKGINISNADIKTGANCVSIDVNSQLINVEKVACGLGIGINVGSLDRSEDEGSIRGVTVRNCTMSNTTGGVAVISSPDLAIAGFASDICFEDIIMNNVTTPILIDQQYCPYDHCAAKVPSRVRISNVVFKNIRGTSASKVVVRLSCSSIVPCEDVKLEEIDLKYDGKDSSAVSEIANMKPAVHERMLLRVGRRLRFSRSSSLQVF